MSFANLANSVHSVFFHQSLLSTQKVSLLIPSGNTKYKNKLHNIVFTDVDVDLNIWCQKTSV